ncbi:hypothetical protein LPJ64_004955 [Coemansia asiatica]|uniref:Uncharacterized protein n=1 Tax=Coemansia asiatica TaxID=1052880 RepID=A0A9W7XFA1_9FUNG|nr:hypothetical protein LPJ64_004955 [Coemansia asiatica]
MLPNLSTIAAFVVSASVLMCKTSATPGATTMPIMCIHGAMKCVSGGYQVCFYGYWGDLVRCPTNTVCKYTSPTSVICGWA